MRPASSFLFIQLSNSRAGSVLNLLEMPEFNHQVQVERGVLGEECGRMLTDFFKELRRKKEAAPPAEKY